MPHLMEGVQRKAPVSQDAKAPPAAGVSRVSFRKLVVNLHLYLGIVGLVFIIILGLTGTVLAFEDDLSNWLARGLKHVPVNSGHVPLDEVIANARKAYQGYRPLFIDVSPADDRALELLLLPERPGDIERLRVFADPYSGRILGQCESCAAVTGLQRLHTSLLLKRPWNLVVGYATALLLFMSVSGLYLWWKRKILRLRARKNFWAFNFNLHNVLGLYLFPLAVVIALTGIVLVFQWPRNLILKLNPPGKAEVRLNRPFSIVVAHAQPLSLDQEIAAAAAALPSYQVRSVALPTRPKDAVTVTLVPADERDERQFRLVFVDQFSGKVLLIWQPDQNPGLGNRLLGVVVGVHTGRVGGLVGQCVMSLASLLIAILAASGVLIWAKRITA
jgi:sulfite reductase (NADPH) flavoprotein alpha-component